MMKASQRSYETMGVEHHFDADFKFKLKENDPVTGMCMQCFTVKRFIEFGVFKMFYQVLFVTALCHMVFHMYCYGELLLLLLVTVLVHVRKRSDSSCGHCESNQRHR